MNPKGNCDYHKSEPIEGEIVRVSILAFYVQLVCSECGRKRGVRRVVK